MATKILEIELSNPGFSLERLDLAGYSDIQMLVRLKGIPLGYTWFKLSSGTPIPDPANMRLEILRQLQWPLLQTTLHQSLSELQDSLNESRSERTASGPSLPLITVAIITRNRSKSLARTLASLTRLDYPSEKMDVLVVDNAPIDQESRRVVAEFPRFRYLLEPRPGLAWGRNRAITEARGEIMAYTDDDVELDPAWLRVIAGCFQNPAVKAVTGLVVPARRDNECHELFEEFGGLGQGFERRYYGLHLRYTWSTFPLNAGGLGAGANMAFRKEILRELGGFDEALGAGTPAGAISDNDLFYRLIRRGYVLLYEPAALLWHHHRDDFEALKQQLYNYGSGEQAFLTKCFLMDKPMRWRALWIAIRHLYRHGIWDIFRQKGVRRKLVWAHALGMLLGPVNYFRSLSHRRRVIARYGDIEWRRSVS